ncbi:hypothetical protein MNBD_GAMMA10-1202 [hydrothermal vent metagenome]|uniref:DUF4123 domain-containing protein n=1 Tax=hydrothermal vent metagenome TaxID=652676 RepID=A0A3B0YXJ1_9ZZZZ
MKKSIYQAIYQSINQPIRITLQQTEQIIQQLWHSELFSEGEKPDVYAILDGARNRKIQPMLKSFNQRHYCLFDGELDYSLTRAAPYMMRLEEGSDFTRELVRQAWGNSWGIFAIAPHNISLIRVRRNCKEIAFVESEQGKKMLFRYYDPRVMRVYLPTCLPDELDMIFGPVSAYVMESEDGTGINCFSLQQPELVLQVETLSIEHYGKEQNEHI